MASALSLGALRPGFASRRGRAQSLDGFRARSTRMSTVAVPDQIVIERAHRRRGNEEHPGATVP